MLRSSWSCALWIVGESLVSCTLEAIAFINLTFQRIFHSEHPVLSISEDSLLEAWKKWNWIVGSDLIYTEEGVQQLAGAMLIMLTDMAATASSGRIIYGHTKGRMPELDEQWENELRANGLTWNILAEVPVTTQENKVWEGRTTLIMDIFLSDK